MKRLDNEKNKTIDYSSGLEQLEKYYDRQFELIKKGNTDLVTLELLMLGKGLDFIRYVHKRLGISLRLSESSVELFEEVTDAFTRGVVQDEFFADETGSIAGNMSAYFGMLIIANIGGNWEDTENGAALNVNGRHVYVYDYIEKRLLGAVETDAVSYYNSVKTVRK